MNNAQRPRPETCLLCGTPATFNVVYLPGKRQLARGRIYIYGLCETCFAQPGHAERAERVIEHSILAAN